MANWEARQALHDFFSRCDCSVGNGFVTRATLRRECSLDDSQIDELFAELDQDSDGRITFDEFASGLERVVASVDVGAWLTRSENPEVQPEVDETVGNGAPDDSPVFPEVTSTRQMTVADAEQTAKELFERCDATGSGYIDRAEFNYGLTSLGFSVNDAELDHLFDSLDQDHDGVISFSDFIKGYSRHYEEPARDCVSVSSPNTDLESGMFEYDGFEDMPLSVPDADLLCGAAGFDRVQEIWDDIRQSHPELLEPLEEVIGTMAQQLKEQKDENMALIEEVSRQNVRHAKDVRALDLEAREQLAEVEELAKSQAEFVEHRIRQELSQRLIYHEDELQMAYDKVEQLEHQVAQKNVTESEMRAQLKQLHEDRVRLQRLLNKTAQRRMSQSSPIGRKYSRALSKRSSSVGTLMDTVPVPEVLVASESRIDLIEELKMLRAVNAELKIQVQDKDDEEAQQDKRHHPSNRQLMKHSSNLGLYLGVPSSSTRDAEVSTHGVISPGDMSPRSNLLFQLFHSSTTASTQTTSLSPTSFPLSKSDHHGSHDSVFQQNEKPDMPSCHPASMKVTPMNDCSSTSSSCVVEETAETSQVSSNSAQLHTVDLSPIPYDTAVVASTAVPRLRHRPVSWPLSLQVKQETVPQPSLGDIQMNSGLLAENLLFPVSMPLKIPHRNGKLRHKLLDEALKYDSSCDSVVCDEDVSMTDGQNAADSNPQTALPNGWIDHESVPNPEYVRGPDTLDTLQAVAHQLQSSHLSTGISFNVGPVQVRQPPDRMYKVVFVGNSNVGKTTLVNQLCTGEFCSFSATIGVDFRVKLVSVDGQLVSLQLWDTAGQEKFRKFGLSNQYYRKADGVILVYDIMDTESFMDIREWVSCVETATGGDTSVCVMLLANKIDLLPVDDGTSERSASCVPLSSGKLLAKQLEALHFEVSAKTGNNVEEACSLFVRTLYDRENRLIESAKVPLRDNNKQRRPKSVIVLGENTEYENEKKCKC